MQRVKTPDTIKAQLYKAKLDAVQRAADIQLAVNIWDRKFMMRYGRHPLPPNQISTFGRNKSNKFYKIFAKVVDFLYSEREQMGAANHMNRLMDDYFDCVLRYYNRFGRIPNINQISPGPVMSSQFTSWHLQEEEHNGGYWLSPQDMIEVEELIKTGGNNYVDPILDPILYPNGR